MLLPGKYLFACYASQSVIMELPSACGRQNNESWIFFFGLNKGVTTQRVPWGMWRIWQMLVFLKMPTKKNETKWGLCLFWEFHPLIVCLTLTWTWHRNEKDRNVWFRDVLNPFYCMFVFKRHFPLIDFCVTFDTFEVFADFNFSHQTSIRPWRQINAIPVIHQNKWSRSVFSWASQSARALFRPRLKLDVSVK